MGSVVTIATSKGGGGKTALTTLLAVNLAPLLRIAVVDADRNATFAHWHRHTYGGEGFACTEEIRHVEVVDTLQALGEGHDLVLCDTAGFENQTAAMACASSDHVLIPVMPDRGSAREAVKTAQQVVALGKAARREIGYLIVPMSWNPRGLAEKATLEDLAEAAAALGLGLPVVRQHIAQSADIRKMSFSGRVPMAGAIGIEIDRLIDELVARGVVPARSAAQPDAA